MTIAVGQKGEPMVDFIIEITFLLATIYFVNTKQDVRFVIFSCTLYLTSVIRHSIERRTDEADYRKE